MSCYKNSLKMIQLPVIDRDPDEIAHLCLCRPICKSRRRNWRGAVLNTSAELLLERKAMAECFRRCPNKVSTNKTCPLFGRTKTMAIKVRGTFTDQTIVRLCQAPVDDKVDTTYLTFVEMAKNLGSFGKCPFCKCGACCPCTPIEYIPRDADRVTLRRRDMKDFDARVKTEVTRRTMYN